MSWLLVSNWLLLLILFLLVEVQFVDVFWLFERDVHLPQRPEWPQEVAREHHHPKDFNMRRKGHRDSVPSKLKTGLGKNVTQKYYAKVNIWLGRCLDANHRFRDNNGRGDPGRLSDFGGDSGSDARRSVLPRSRQRCAEAVAAAMAAVVAASIA